MKKNLIFLLVCITLLALSLSACEKSARLQKTKEEVSQLRRNVTDGKTSKGQMEKFELPKAVTYQASIPQAASRSSPQIKQASAHPLQDYPLNSLQFIGVLSQDNTVLAYILTPDNVMHQAKEGDMIGNNYGKIVKITPEQVEVLIKKTEAGKEEKAILKLKD